MGKADPWQQLIPGAIENGALINVPTSLPGATGFAQRGCSIISGASKVGRTRSRSTSPSDEGVKKGDPLQNNNARKFQVDITNIGTNILVLTRMVMMEYNIISLL